MILPLRDGLLDPQDFNLNQAPGVRLRGRAARRDGAWLVSLFLVNEQSSPKVNKDEAGCSSPSFASKRWTARRCSSAVARRCRTATRTATSRNSICSIATRSSSRSATAWRFTPRGRRGDPSRAVQIETRVMPRYEVPRVEAPTATEEPGLAPVVLDMKTLSELPTAQLVEVLRPLAVAYDGWLDRQEARIDDPGERLGALKSVARDSLARARSVAARLHAGIERLAADEIAAEAFRFANRAMWQQRVHTVAAAARRAAAETPFDDLLAAADVPAKRSWRPFQLAFVLLNLPSLVDPTHPERSPNTASVDLLFFPTGGGKTEAYLGLTAFTLAIRRLQGVVGGHDGAEASAC